MIIDFLAINLTNVLLFTVLLNIFYLNDNNIYLILIIDILLNGIPYVTIIILIIYYLNKTIFKIINNNFINKLILIIIYYFIFGIIIYSIFNKFSFYIIRLLIKNLLYNVIFYYLGLKYYENKYNLIGRLNEKEKIS